MDKLMNCSSEQKICYKNKQLKKNRNHETHPFAPCSPVAALPRAVALRVLSAGEVCYDGGIRRYGIHVL